MLINKSVFMVLILILLFIIHNFKLEIPRENFENDKNRIVQVKNNIYNKFKLFYQYPVITEKICKIQNTNKNNYLDLPWATIIDKGLYNQVLNYLNTENINYFPTHNLISASQHIHFKNIVLICKKLGVKTLYISHKVKEEDIMEGIILKAMPLYAVNVENKDKNKTFQNINFLSYPRKYLFSFIGATDHPQYLTDIRKNIYNYRNKYPENTVIEKKIKWHFQDVVYQEQTQNKELSSENIKKHNNSTEKYNQILLNSRYSLCPSGTGPNSIRFWESLAIGSIPILLSDTLELPLHKLWDSSILIVPEKKYKDIPNIIAKISQKEEDKRRYNCIKIYQDFKDSFIN